MFTALIPLFIVYVIASSLMKWLARRAEEKARVAREQDQAAQRRAVEEGRRHAEQQRRRERQAESERQAAERNLKIARAVDLGQSLESISLAQLQVVADLHPDQSMRNRARLRINELERKRQEEAEARLRHAEARRFERERLEAERLAANRRRIEQVRERQTPYAVRLAKQNMAALDNDCLGVVAGFHPEASVRAKAVRLITERERRGGSQSVDAPEIDSWREQA